MPAEDPSADTAVPAGADPAQESVFEPEPVLPEAVRQRVINLAASAITGLPIDELPTALRRVAKFAPNRRARLGGPIIATQLAADPLLRQRLASKVVDENVELGQAIAEGATPASDTTRFAQSATRIPVSLIEGRGVEGHGGSAGAVARLERAGRWRRES